MAYSKPGKTREKVFRFVRDRLLEGSPPTIREVQDAMGFRSVESARKQLEILVEEGRLVKSSGKARGFRLPQDVRGGTPVPLVGEIQAGGLRAAIEHPDGFVVASRSRHNETLFALTVRGESMRDAGMFDGDTVIVRKQSTANDGEVVVALVGDEATVKRFRSRRGKIVLEPANPEFAPMTFEPGECQLLGRVVELRRRF